MKRRARAKEMEDIKLNVGLMRGNGDFRQCDYDMEAVVKGE